MLPATHYQGRSARLELFGRKLVYVLAEIGLPLNLHTSIISCGRETDEERGSKKEKITRDGEIKRAKTLAT